MQNRSKFLAVAGSMAASAGAAKPVIIDTTSGSGLSTFEGGLRGPPEFKPEFVSDFEDDMKRLKTEVRETKNRIAGII